VNLLSSEISDWSAALAPKIARLAARWSTDDPDLAATRADEWAELVYSCPGKVTKFAYAVSFLPWGAGGQLSRLTKRVIAYRGRLGARTKKPEMDKKAPLGRDEITVVKRVTVMNKYEAPSSDLPLIPHRKFNENLTQR
jgi:hypothetical protein